MRYALGGPRISEVGLWRRTVPGIGLGTHERRDLGTYRAPGARRGRGTFSIRADAYWNGRSERVLGKALCGRREQVVLATKGGWWYVDGVPYCDFSLIYLCRAVEAQSAVSENGLYRSLLHPRSGYRDHSAKRCLRVSEPVEREGNHPFRPAFSVDTVEQARLCIDSGCVDVIQVYYNILDQRPDPGLFEAARAAGVGTVIKAPMARGSVEREVPERIRGFQERTFGRIGAETAGCSVALARVARVEALVGGRSPTLAADGPQVRIEPSGTCRA